MTAEYLLSIQGALTAGQVIKEDAADASVLAPCRQIEVLVAPLLVFLIQTCLHDIA